MSNIINENRFNYSIVPTKLIQDNTLSMQARCVYCYMTSKPDDWSFYLEPMADDLNISTRTLRKYINELVSSGWITQGKQENKGGVFGAVMYTIKNTPWYKKPQSVISDTQKERHAKNSTLHNIDYIHNKDNIENKDNSMSKSKDSALEQEFDRFRKAYLGKKRGLKPELENLKKRQKAKWREIIPLLMPALQSQIEAKKKATAAGQWTAQWKNLQTWINQECWTEEPAKLSESSTNKNSVNDLWGNK